MYVPQTEVILRHGNEELARVTLPPGDYIIGRGPDAEIFADTPLISRQHARLHLEYDQLFVEDLGSSNGTFINGRPVTDSTRLYPGQAIRLGDVEVELRRQRPPTQRDVSLPPAQDAIRRFLPDELLAEKRYAIGAQIARGGMGAILDARQNATQRNVAMKVMLGAAGEGDVVRFIEEAQVTAQLEHPNIVPIHELGVDEQGQLFYTMRMVRGITLKKVLELLAQGVEFTVKKYPLPALLTIFQKVCDALAFAHNKGVLHRDLKPENIMLGDFGSVLVMDWGLAKRLGKDARAASGAHFAPPSAGGIGAQTPFDARTMAGTIMGTPAYMSPEQARGEIDALDARSDLYSLGLILFEMLHLRQAMTGQSTDELVSKAQRGEVVWPGRQPFRLSGPAGVPPADEQEARLPGQARRLSSVPDSLLAVCRKALALEPAQRYESVEALQRDLAAYQAGRATSAEHAGLAKQLFLLLKRHKFAALGLSAFVLTGSILGTHAILEGRRAERAMAELRRQAPALRDMADAEAGFLRFDSALEKLDAALSLEPAYLPSYWRRAWLLVGLERYDEAAKAIQLAKRKDPKNAPRLAAILPLVEQLATTSPENRWTPERSVPLSLHLEAVGAAGERTHLSRHWKLGGEARRTLVAKRIDRAAARHSAA